MPFNAKIITQETFNQSDKILVKTVRPRIEKDFLNKKKRFLKDFDSHPVTKELNRGPNAKSQYINTDSSGGNLFSLIGFSADQRPTDALRDFFDKNIKIGKTTKSKIKGQSMIFSTKVNIPTISNVNSAMANNPDTELEWTNRSFTDLIARGVSGLSYYLFGPTKKLKNSRSGTAIQTRSKLRNFSTRPIKYVNELLENFVYLFRK